MWRLLGLVALGLVAGCGGHVEGGSKEPVEQDPSEAAGQDSATPSGTLDTTADTALGACELGPLASDNPNEPCAWLVNNRCYATRDMACNCACPRDGNSLCLSGFDGGPNGYVPVTCD